MLLFRTVCSTDWKSRPSHSLVLIANPESRAAAIEAMDKDVVEWMAADIAADEYNAHEGDEELPDGWDTARADELVATKTPKELLAIWITEDRFEMAVRHASHREFVECDGDGNRCTTVYHLMDDDHEHTVLFAAG